MAKPTKLKEPSGETIKLGDKTAKLANVVRRGCAAGILVEMDGKVGTLKCTDEDDKAVTLSNAELQSALLRRQPLTDDERRSASLMLNWVVPVTDHSRDEEWRNAVLYLCELWKEGVRAWDDQWNRETKRLRRELGLNW